MEKIEIAKIGKAQGIKGEVKINLYSSNTALLRQLKSVFIGEIEYEIETVKVLPNGSFIKLKGINDRNTAELLNGKPVSVFRGAIHVPDGSYLISDLIDACVCVDGDCVGKLTEVLQHGAADVYCVSGKRNFMFPALNKVLVNVDVVTKTIDLNSEELERVVVYDDEN